MRLPCVCCEPLRIPLISFSPSSHSLSLSLSVRKVTPVPTASAGTRAICHWRLAAELVTWRALVGLPSCTNHLAHPLMGTVRLSFTYRQKHQGRFQHCHAVQDALWAFRGGVCCYERFACRKLRRPSKNDVPGNSLLISVFVTCHKWSVTSQEIVSLWRVTHALRDELQLRHCIGSID